MPKPKKARDEKPMVHRGITMVSVQEECDGAWIPALAITASPGVGIYTHVVTLDDKPRVITAIYAISSNPHKGAFTFSFVKP